MQIRQAGTRGTDHSNRITRVPCFTENYTPYLPFPLHPLLFRLSDLTVGFVSRAFDKHPAVLAPVHTAELLTID